jgi:hypothetical protein
MMAFWMLLGGAAGIKVAQRTWQLLGWGIGNVSIAVPVGGVIGALIGGLLGLISNPRFLVLMMAVFAGASAGAVAGKLAWGQVGEIGGQVCGVLLGTIAWAVSLFIERRKGARLGAQALFLGGQESPGRNMMDNRRISQNEARSVGASLGVDWAQIDLEQFRRGLEVELEHGARDPQTNVTNNDILLTGKIAWAHLKEIQDYYTRLDQLEAEAKDQT